LPVREEVLRAVLRADLIGAARVVFLRAALAAQHFSALLCSRPRANTPLNPTLPSTTSPKKTINKGFHTYDYARHFISSCTRILGLEGTPEGVEDNGGLTRVAAFPIGIDPERFTAAMEDPEVQTNVAKLLARCAQERREGKRTRHGRGRGNKALHAAAASSALLASQL
jgi:trehalose-6-phosphate synthase